MDFDTAVYLLFFFCVIFFLRAHAGDRDTFSVRLSAAVRVRVRGRAVDFFVFFFLFPTREIVFNTTKGEKKK